MTESPKFIAEHVPAYNVEPWLDKPWSDEDCAMSAPERVGRFDTEDDARQALVDDLTKIADNCRERAEFSEYYRQDFLLFSAAAAVINQGSTAVKVHGRYYRVRPANERGW